MIYEDLKLFDSLSDGELKTSIYNKYKTEMIYYYVIEEMMAKYGTNATRKMSDIDPDALGCVRDQLAMRASDAGLIQYEENTGYVKNELNDEAIRKLITASCNNSTSFETAVSTYLATHDSHTIGMSLDDLYEYTIKEFDKISNIDDPNSIAYKIYQKVQRMEEIAENSFTSKYAMRAHEEIITNHDTQADRTFDDNKIKYVLKISPLMPEFENLRKLDIPVLGLYKDTKEAEDDLNSVLMYDSQKALLTKVYAEDTNHEDITVGNELYDGIVLRPSEHVMQMQYYMTNTRTEQVPDDYEGDDVQIQLVSTAYENAHGEKITEEQRVRQVRNTVVTQAYDENTNNTNFNMYLKWRMINTIEKYSQQKLVDRDINIINDMFERNDTTMFGDVNDDFNAVMENADAYFDYIEHVCKTMKNDMSSHEFEIHFRRVPYLEKGNDDQKYSDDMAVMMYITGERTSEFNVARRNSARYLGVYTYLDYSPVRGDVSPILGDIAPAAYNEYFVTDREMREEVGDENNPQERYTRAKYISKETVAKMRAVFDAYTDHTHADNLRDIIINKNSRRVGETDVKDLSEYINPNDYTVRTHKIKQTLCDAIDAVKEESRIKYQYEECNAFFDKAVMNYISRYASENSNDKNYADVRTEMFEKMIALSGGSDKLKSVLKKEMNREITNEYGNNIDMAVMYKHVMSNYIDRYIDDYSENKITAISEFNQQQNEEILEESLNELFGQYKINSRNDTISMVIKPNLISYVSNSLNVSDYDDLMRMLSYTDDVIYEPDMSKKIVLQDDNKTIIQLYSPADSVQSIYEEDENVSDSEQIYRSSFVSYDEAMWYNSMFSSINNNDDISYAMLTDASSESNTIDMIRFRAMHPLQHEALKRAHESLRNDPDYKPEDLRMTRKGILYYYNSEEEKLKLKIGPIIDEKAYIRPYVFEDLDMFDNIIYDTSAYKLVKQDADGKYHYENITEQSIDDGLFQIRENVDRVVYDSQKYPVCDAQGKVTTKKCDEVIIANAEIIKNGVLLNEVKFGALDTAMLTGDSHSIPKRFYGVSAKIEDYDGYNHEDFSERLSFHTYQAGVLDMLDKNLALYHIAQNDNELKAAQKQIAASIMYTNVCANSLQKCYRTNTYIMEDNAKCKVADEFLTNYYDDVNNSADISDYDNKAKIASLMMSQSDMYRSRVIRAKIATSQNIALYNLVNNLQQCSKDEVRGKIDRKDMRNTDTMGSRVSMFRPNPIFDPTLTATAKQLGAVAFLSTDTKLDRITGELTVRQNADNTSRSILTAKGVEDYITGQVQPFLKHPDGQAADRMQLSFNALEKCLNYSDDIKFAMINLGYNMEDGYVVSKRSLHKLGHFDENGKYHDLQLWDKIGDSESGNKGVVAKIVDTDIGEGMNDQDALRAFKIHMVKNFLPTYHINYYNEFKDTENDFYKAIDVQFNSKYPHIMGIDFQQKLEQADDNTRDEMYASIADHLIDNKIKPFYQSYQFEHNIWQLFRDNKDLDLAITNVCVLTRSNPSLLMSMADDFETDMAILKDDIAANSSRYVDILDPENYDDESFKTHLFEIADRYNDNNSEKLKSLLITRDEDNIPHVSMCAKGSYTIYTDTNTAEHKNRDYVESAAKAGRKYGAQEMYMFQAKKCNNAFIKFITANDPVLSNHVAKMNRKLMMNGFMIDFESQDGQILDLTDAINNIEMSESENKISYQSEDLKGYSFVDMTEIARKIIDESGIKDFEDDAAIKNMVEDLDFGKLLSKNGENAINDISAETLLHNMFISTFGENGGDFMILPDMFKNTKLAVKHEINTEIDSVPFDFEDSDNPYDYMPDSNIDDSDYAFSGYRMYMSEKEMDLTQKTLSNKIFMPDGTEKNTAPLFISSREVLSKNDSSQVDITDDKLQYEIFKTALAGAIVREIYTEERCESDPTPKAKYNSYAETLKKSLSEQYESITRPINRSLNIEDMSQWLKKNIYATVCPTSITSVWCGNPNMDIDRVGISFEKAKSLGILEPIDGELKYPDTYENMYKNYKPIDDDTYCVINRSPGQTTGCARALKPCIVAESGNGIMINPALATIFDGDFDGDTIGVINPFKINNITLKDKYAELVVLKDNALLEIKHTATMESNLVHTADYTDVEIPGTDEIITHVNPLFIAGNADVAIAKYCMVNDKDCDYDVKSKLEQLTVKANLTEQYKQIVYDCVNMSDNSIDIESGENIINARLNQIEKLNKYCKANGFDWQDQNSGIVKSVEKLITNFDKDAVPDVINKIHDTELDNMHELRDVYRDITAYMTKKPLYTHGESQFDMIKNIVADANISKKGKAPQLNALLKYSGLHADCNPDHKGLVVQQNPKTKQFEIVSTSDDIEIDKLKMDHRKAYSDVPLNRMRSQIESSIIAQSDKSDGTGYGGGVAQKMQKLFAYRGYGEIGLRISGPITQIFLDAKQNIMKCEKNMNVASVLNKICNFERVNELTDKYVEDIDDITRVYNGQFTYKDDKGDVRGLSLDEGVSQLNNFLKMMGQPEFSEIDKAVVKACIKPYVETTKNGDEIIKNPIQKADKQGDMSYALMYGGHNTIELMESMRKNNTGIWSGSRGYSNNINMDQILEDMTRDCEQKNKTAQLTLDNLSISKNEVKKVTVETVAEARVETGVKPRRTSRSNVLKNLSSQATKSDAISRLNSEAKNTRSDDDIDDDKKPDLCE